MKKYDVVIIGAGLGGLECGIILSREGMDVCVVEQHSQPGGNLQTFSRKGCIFDTGMHYIGSMAPGQYLHKYFKYFGIAGKLRLKQLDTDGFDTITFDGDEREYLLSQGYDRFVSTLTEQFPGEGANIERYVTKIRSVTADFPLFNLSAIDTYYLPRRTLEGCAQEFLSGLSRNDRLKNVLAGAESLYPGHESRTPMYVHACVRSSLVNSCWRPVDGSQQIADLLTAGIHENGGTVMTSQKVKEIIIGNDKARGVVLESGETVFADTIISNAHPVASLNMIAEGKIRNIYRKRIMGLKNSRGMFAVYAIVKKDAFAYLNRNYFHYGRDGILNAVHDEGRWPENYYFYTPAMSGTGSFAESIVMLADMSFEEVSRWKDTTVNRRGPDYEEFKAHKAELALAALERRLPGIREKIASFYTSTPLTFRDYTATHEGAAYGIMKDCRDPVKSIILPRTKVSNLFFTGQNLNLHGIMGVTASAVITCSEILGLGYLTKKIANG